MLLAAPFFGIKETSNALDADLAGEDLLAQEVPELDLSLSSLSRAGCALQKLLHEVFAKREDVRDKLVDRGLVYLGSALWHRRMITSGAPGKSEG